jgi:2-oxoglutarate/2-oxoacid ferredoxin oxidoreductase subunit alpha
MDRLLRSTRKRRGFRAPRPSSSGAPGARVGVVTIGGCDPAVREALDILAAQGIAADFMRIRGFPFDEPVEKFLESTSSASSSSRTATRSCARC